MVAGSSSAPPLDPSSPSMAGASSPADRQRLAGQWLRIGQKRERGSTLTHAETVVDLVLSLRAEINNGGFNQFFFNSSGDYAKETGPALHEVGLHDLATMYEQALAAFPGVPSADVGARRDQMTEVPAKTSALWRGLEDRLYADHDRDDRSDAALIAYLRKHGADF